MSDDDAAREHFERVPGDRARVDHRELEGECERNLGELALERAATWPRRAGALRALAAESAARPRTGAARRRRCGGPGKADIAAGDGSAARDEARQALRAFQAFEMNARDAGLPRGPCGAPAVGRRRGRCYAPVRGRQGVAGEARATASAARRKTHWRAVAAARGALGDAGFDAAWTEGKGWTLEQAIRCALASEVPVTA